MRLASLAVQFCSREGTGVPAKLADWSVEPESNSSVRWTIGFASESSPELSIDAFRHEAQIGRRGGRSTGRRPRYDEALLELLIYHEVLPIHAAAFTSRRSGGGATMLCAPSGGGKSSLSWLAASAGHGLLSDDHLGLRRSPHGLELIPLKRSIAVDRRLLPDSPIEGRDEPLLNGGSKVRFDPETLLPCCRILSAQPQRLVFLEKGSERKLEPISPAQAFVRLVPQSAALLPSGQRLMPLLNDLVGLVPTVVATLTRSCLKDPGVLEELGA